MAVSDSLFGNPEGYMDYMQVLQGAGQPVQNRPKAVLFGDSMSEYVGYNADGTPNTRYGNSIADVIGNNLGINVTNLATGGETSNEALAGGSKFGAFADYIAQNKPEYAIIRYGAADAIKNQDPNVTLQSIQQMVDIARANGVTPIIVGVSELYGAQNSKTGNIAGYIDPAAEQRANIINAGLAQLASRNGLAFTDVRSAVSAGQGDLLDGVHTNADFGKKMADAISESIVEQGAIQGANVPQLPPNVDALSNEEKGRLYNQFIEQGYSDAQIRTAAKAESDQDWNALKQIAASVKNTTPATIERRAALEAAPTASTSDVASQSLLGAQPKLVPDDVKSQLDAFGPYDPNSEVWYFGGPQIVYEGKIYRKDPSGNIDITVAGGGPGSLQQVVSPTGELLLSDTVTGETSRLMAFFQNALPAAAAAAFLGPAGAGLFSAPTAAAIGSGGTTLARGGSIEDALKAAAIAGLGAYGTSEVLSTLNQGAYDLSFAAADAAQLANQGLDAAAIAQNLSTYVDPSVAASLANTAANQAFALADANQLVQQGLNANQVSQVLQASGVDATTAASLAQAATEGVTQLSPSDIVPDLKFQKTVGTSSQLPTLPDSVTVTGQGVTGDLFNIPATSVGGLLSAANLPTLPEILQAATQQVQVTGQNQAAQTTAPEAVGGALAGVTPQAPAQQVTNQQVQVTGQTAANNVDADTASAVLSNLLGQPVTVQGGTQRLDITGQNIGQTITPEVAASLLSAAAGQSVSITGQNIPKTESTASTVGNIISAITPSVPSGAEQVEVTGRRDTSLLPQLGGAVTAALPGVPAGVTAELPKPLEPAQKTTDQSLFKPSDVLKLIGLLGGAGAGSALAGAGGGIGMGGVPPSDTMIGTTTPQFGPDYYAAVQQYYNTYMPQTPRNVATPLQQWYENKFGA